MNKGFLIVIDGIDGAGKTSQIELLKKYFAQKGTPFEAISFPRYGQNIYANLVKRYLVGEFGSISDVNSYLMALAYAGDRMLAKPLIEKWLKSRKLVIANRYVSSSKAHLGANLLGEQRDEFIKWIDKLEYETNGMLREDLTILLDVDPKVGQSNVQEKPTPDIHEESLKHQIEANKIYLELSQTQTNWVVVNCMKDDQMRDKEDIRQEIIKILSTKLPT